MGRKRGRESTVAETATPVSTPRQRKKPRTSLAASPRIPPSGPEVEYQLAGSSRSWTSSLKSSSDLNKLIVLVADNLKIPLYGTLIRFSHVKQDGSELEIYDKYDFDAFRQDIIATGARKAVIRVYSASGSTIPVYSTPTLRNTSLLRRQSPISTPDLNDRAHSDRSPSSGFAEGSHISLSPPNRDESSSSEDELFPTEGLQNVTSPTSSPVASHITNTKKSKRKRRRPSKLAKADDEPAHYPPPLPKPKQLKRRPPPSKSKHVESSLSGVSTKARLKAPAQPGRTTPTVPALSSDEESDAEDQDPSGDYPLDEAHMSNHEDDGGDVESGGEEAASAQNGTPPGARQDGEDTDSAESRTSRQTVDATETLTGLAKVSKVPSEDPRQPSNEIEPPDHQPNHEQQHPSHPSPKPANHNLPLPSRKVISLSLFEPAGLLANQPESKPGRGLLSSSSFRWSSSESENELGLNLDELAESSEDTSVPPNQEAAASAPAPVGGRNAPIKETEAHEADRVQMKKRSKKKGKNVSPVPVPQTSIFIPSATEPVVDNTILPNVMKPMGGAKVKGKKGRPKQPEAEQLAQTTAEQPTLNLVQPELPSQERSLKKPGRVQTKPHGQSTSPEVNDDQTDVNLQSEEEATNGGWRGQVTSTSQATLAAQENLANSASAVGRGPEVPPALVEASSSRSTSSETDYFTPNDGIQGAKVPSAQLVLKSHKGQVQHLRLQNRASCIICDSIPSHLQKDCPVVKGGVDSLLKLLTKREMESEPKEKSIGAIHVWINRLTKIHEKVNGTTTTSSDVIPEFAPPIKASTLAAFNEREPSPPPAASAQKSTEVAAKRKGTPDIRPPRVKQRISEATSLPAIFHRALVKAGRPGSQSGLSVSDAVIETGSSASSESDSEGEQSDSPDEASSEEDEAASDSDDDSAPDEGQASETESTVSMSSGDAVRHFLSKPLSAKQQRRARESAASMSASQPLMVPDEGSSQSETNSDADEDIVINVKTRRAGSADSSIGDFEHDDQSAVDTSPGSHSDILPVTQPPEIALARDDIESAETVEPLVLKDVGGSANDDLVEGNPKERSSLSMDTIRNSSRHFGALDANLGPSPVMANFPGHNALQEIIEEDKGDTAYAEADRDRTTTPENFQATQVAKTAHGLPSPPSSIHDSANGDAAQVHAISQTFNGSVGQKPTGRLAPPADIRTTRSISRSARSTSRDVTKSPVRMTRAMSKDASHPVSPKQTVRPTPSTPRRTRGRSTALDADANGESVESPTINESPSDQPLRRVLRSSQIDELESSQPPEAVLTPKQQGQPRNKRDKQSSPLFFTQSQVPSTQTYNAVPPQTQSFNQSNARESRSDVTHRSSIRMTSPIAEEDEEEKPSSAASASASDAEAPSFASALEPAEVDDNSSYSKSPRASPRVNDMLEPPSGSESEEEPPVVTIRTRPQAKAAASQPLISIPSLSSLSKERLRGRNSQPALTTQSQPIPKLAVDSESSNDDEDSSSEEEVPPKSAALRSRFANGSLRKRQEVKRPNGQLKGW